MMKFIIVLSFVAFLAIQSTAGEEFKCVQGVSYITNECNVCFCGPTGILGCSLKLCPEVNTAKLFNCEVGTTWKKGEEQCWCVKKQGTICTNQKA